MADLKIQQLDGIIPVTTNVWVGQNDMFVVKMKARGTAPLDEDRKLTWAQLVSSLQLGQYMPTVGGTFTGNVTLNNNISLMGKQSGSGATVPMMKMDANNNVAVGSATNTLLLYATVPPKYDDGQNQWDVITTKNLPTPGQLSGGAAYTKAEVDAKDALKLDKTGGTVTGDIILDKDKYLVGKTASGTSAYLARLLTSNSTVYLGDQTLQTRVVSSAIPLWDNGTTTYRFYTENNKPTSDDIGTYTKVQIDAKDALKLDKTGGEMTGKITLANNISLSAKTASGTERTMAYIDAGNISHFGDVVSNTHIDSAIVPVWGTSSNTYKFYTEFNKPTHAELGLTDTVNKAATAMQPGAFGLGGTPAHRPDSDFLTTTDKTEFFTQDGSSTEQRFGGAGAGVHIYYGTVGTGNATQYISTSVFTRIDGQVVSKVSALDYQGNLVNTLTNTLYGTLNKPSASDVGAYSKTEGDARYARQGVNSDITALNGLTGALRVGANAINPLDVTTLQQVQAMTSGTAGAVVGVVGGFIGAVMWFNGTDRSKIPAGWVASDGQLLNRVDYPDLWAAVNSGALITIDTDANWIAAVTNRGKYSTGNGTSTFRVPDMNGVQKNGVNGFTGANSIVGLYARGDGGVVANNGLVRQNSAPNVVGTAASIGIYANVTQSGSLTWTNAVANRTAPVTGTNDFGGATLNLDASKSNAAYGRDATGEVHSNEVIGIWIIRASSNFQAANTSFSVINGDATRPATDTVTTGGTIKSDYQIGGVPEGVVTLYSNVKIGGMYAGELSVYNNTKGTTASFSFDDDGSFRVPNRIIVDNPTLPGYILNTNGVTTGRLIQESNGKLSLINDKVGRALTIEANGTLNYAGPCYINSTGTFTGHIYSASATQNGSIWSSTGIVSKLLNRGGYGTPDGAYGVFATSEHTGSYYQAEITINGFATDRTWAFRNDGNAYATSGAWVNSSDERLKTNITRIADPLTKMRQVKGCTWDRVDSDAKGVGFIAQDIQAIIPEAVHISEATKTLDDGTVLKDVLALDTAGAAAALHHEAILALMVEIESLKSEIAKLKK